MTARHLAVLMMVIGLLFVFQVPTHLVEWIAESQPGFGDVPFSYYAQGVPWLPGLGSLLMTVGMVLWAYTREA